MVEVQKSRAALTAIHAVLVLARRMAYEGRRSELAAVLDIAEYLPVLMLESEDRTEEFRMQLVDLAESHPAFEFALARFDAL